MFLALSSVKESVIGGSYIRKVLKDKEFEKILIVNELKALEAFKSLYYSIFCSIGALDYQDWV